MNDPLAEKLGSFFTLSGLFGILALLCLLGAIVAGIVLVVRVVKARRASRMDGVAVAHSGNGQMGAIKDQHKH